MNLEDNTLATGVSDSPLATCHLPLVTEKKAAPFFSIIIPVYNVAPYLRECLDSVLAQTFTDWECLCVNDGSTDESGSILDEYAQKDPRFRVFHKPNGGVSSARNLALDNAKGEWIGFLDGDDVWTKDALVCFRNGISDNPQCQILRGEYQPFEEEEKAVLDEYEEGKFTFSILDIHEQIKSYDFIHYLFWGYFYKRSLIGNLRFPRYARGEDRVFLAEILLNRVDSVLICSYYFYGYCQRRGSAVHQNPSVQTLKDELSHRADIIQMIGASGKKMPYKKSYWLEGYCLQGYLSLVEGANSLYSMVERQDLIAWFYRERKRFSKAKDFSLIGKLVAHLYAIHFGKLWRTTMRFILWGDDFVRRVLSYFYRHYIRKVVQ